MDEKKDESLETAAVSTSGEGAVLSGLGAAEVEAARREHGFNEIPEQREAAWRRLLKRLWGPIPWMIEAAGILSAVAEKWEDFTIICVLLVVNVFIDFRQESKALSALAILREKLARTARVLREGQWREIPARELVPGDVVKVRIGDLVPADLELIAGDFLQLDQSALTGESLPVSKGRGDDAYANAIVKMGEMTGRVKAIALETYFGKTVSLVARAEREENSHFQRAVIQVGNFLIALALVLVVLIICVALYRGDPPLEILRFCLVLAVASIPVALPAVLSVTMAVGAVRLSKHQAIVSRLVAIEELAGVDVLCSDKTGTLTQNRMALGEPVAFGSYAGIDVLTNAALASREENADPLEVPVFEALKARGAYAAVAAARLEQFTPFDPVHKRTQATVLVGDERWVITKGAAQVIFGLCVPGEVPKEADARVRDLASRGNRTLAVARRRPEEERFHPVGLMPLFDPPREDSAETLTQARQLGLEIKMITGDNQAIAEEIAGQLGIEGEIHRSAELAEQSPENGLDGLQESELLDLVERSGGFAEVLPEDKYRIVEVLQHKDHIVAMTGDGVNDAPALRKADAGIAVSGATDAARAAADLVLMAPGLSVIVRAIEESRMIFERMGSYSVFRIAETMRVILFMTLAIVVFNFYPVTAIMIILLALLNDIPIMTIAYDNASIAEKPVKWNMKEVLTVASVLGVAGVTSSFLIFLILVSMGIPEHLLQAILFLKLDVAGHSTIYVTRSGTRHFWQRPYPSWRLLLATVSTQLAGALIACYGIFMPAIGWAWVGWIYLYATAWFVLNDFIKVWTYRFIRRNGADRELAPDSVGNR